jgi:hypothetical protein
MIGQTNGVARGCSYAIGSPARMALLVSRLDETVDTMP